MLKNISLSQALNRAWNAYEKQVHLARKTISTRNIHQLRISTQRLEAALTLAHSLRSTHHSKNVIALMKQIRKNLGPLRDAQVESSALTDLRERKIDGHEQREFSTFFSEQKNKAKIKAVKCLKGISLGHERKRVEKIIKRLEQIEVKHDQKQIQSQLESKMKSSVSKFNKVMKNIDPDRIKEIHRFRIMAKKLRYQGECINQLTGSVKYDLQNLKTAQSVAGRIQNDNILIGTLDKFLSKRKHKNEPKAKQVKKRIEFNQAKLIKKDFANLTNLKWEN
jgi:CHAD domain-containing protein